MCSVSMVLLNKKIAIGFPFFWTALLVQNVGTVLLGYCGDCWDRHLRPPARPLAERARGAGDHGPVLRGAGETSPENVADFEPDLERGIGGDGGRDLQAGFYGKERLSPVVGRSLGVDEEQRLKRDSDSDGDNGLVCREADGVGTSSLPTVSRSVELFSHVDTSNMRGVSKEAKQDNPVLDFCKRKLGLKVPVLWKNKLWVCAQAAFFLATLYLSILSLYFVSVPMFVVARNTLPAATAACEVMWSKIHREEQGFRVGPMGVTGLALTIAGAVLFVYVDLFPKIDHTSISASMESQPGENAINDSALAALTIPPALGGSVTSTMVVPGSARESTAPLLQNSGGVSVTGVLYLAIYIAVVALCSVVDKSAVRILAAEEDINPSEDNQIRVALSVPFTALMVALVDWGWIGGWGPNMGTVAAGSVASGASTIGAAGSSTSSNGEDAIVGSSDGAPPLVVKSFVVWVSSLVSMDALVFLALMLSVVFGFGIGTASLYLQKAIAAATLQVANIVYKLLTTAAAMVFFPTTISWLQWCGYGISILGVGLYVWGRTISPSSEKVAAAAGFKILHGLWLFCCRWGFFFVLVAVVFVFFLWRGWGRESVGSPAKGFLGSGPAEGHGSVQFGGRETSR